MVVLLTSVHASSSALAISSEAMRPRGSSVAPRQWRWMGQAAACSLSRFSSAVQRHAGAAGTLLEATDLYGSHDDIRTLFRIPRLVVKPGQKLAVVGSNGCGKSTLLAALSGRNPAKGGEVKLRPGARVAVVDQNPRFDPEKSVTDTIYANANSKEAVASQKYREFTRSGGSPEELQAALDVMEEAEAWDWDTNVANVIKELGLEQMKDRAVGTLSGGEERRVALAIALVDLKSTDLLVLDEPTNHLSSEGCEWLQGTLQAADHLSLILVTHDRYFLDEVSDQILELDGLGETFSHPGGWQDFLKRREERYQIKASQVADARVQLKRAEEWMARGPRGRGTKNKAQISGFHEVKDRSNAVIAADDGAPLLQSKFLKAKDLTASAKLLTLSFRNVTVELPGRGAILKQISVDFTPGMKIGIVGPNGAGKSTLVKALIGDIPLASGERILGDGVLVGHLPQEQPEWPDPTRKVMDVVGDMTQMVIALSEGKSLTKEKATADLLKSINFAQSRWQTQVGMLSGGESRRLQLLSVLSQRPNVLILDEPTNDLDAVTVDALEQMLQPWPGTVILVSHDRSLLDGVCNTLLVMQPDGSQPQVWQGSHQELRDFQKQKEKSDAKGLTVPEAKSSIGNPDAGPPAVASEAATPARTGVSASREQRQAKKQLKKVEDNIEKLEAELAVIDSQMAEFYDDAKKLLELTKQRQKLEEAQTELYERWEEAVAAAGEG